MPKVLHKHEARDLRWAREIASAMLAVLRDGPTDHLSALSRLKIEGRCSYGVTAGAALNAFRLLAEEGKITRVEGSPFKWRVRDAS